MSIRSRIDSLRAARRSGRAGREESRAPERERERLRLSRAVRLSPTSRRPWEARERRQQEARAATRDRSTVPARRRQGRSAR